MKNILALLVSLLLCVPAFPCLAAEAADELFSAKDLTLADAGAATPILLDGQTVTIDRAGAYVVSGQIANGALRVCLAEKGTVYLLLNGVTVHNDAGAALYTENCEKVIVTLAEGTENAFSQGSAGSEEEEAAICCWDDLTINGTGSLVVVSEYKDGINSRDSLKLVDGVVTVSAADDGLVGKDAVIIGGGTLNVTAVNDGVKATNAEDAARGYVTVAGGSVTVVTTGTSASATAEAGGDASDGAASFPEGMTPPDGASFPDGMTPPSGAPDGASVEAPQSLDAAGRPGKGGGRGPGGGHGFGGRDFGGQAAGGQTALASSAKGIKAVTTLTVSGGTLNVNAADDALHAMDVVLSGGRLTLASGDDGVHADNSLLISGGTVEITQSYEGLEAALITIAGGETSVTASDDGVNGAGGDLAEQTTDGTATQTGRGFFGGDFFSSSTGEVVITGGVLRIDARGDGLDSNGSVTMSGGQVYVCGPTNSGNGALDYNGEFTMTGGTLMAVGASGMAQGVSAPSVAGVAISVDGAPGTISVADNAGTIVLAMESGISYTHAVIYSDLLQEGGSYALTTPNGAQSVTMSTEATMAGGGWGWR